MQDTTNDIYPFYLLFTLVIGTRWLTEQRRKPTG